MTVSVRQAQLELASLITRSSKGEEVIIASDDGQTAARLVPATVAAAQLTPGFLKGKIEIVADDQGHLEDFAEYMQ